MLEKDCQSKAEASRAGISLASMLLAGGTAQRARVTDDVTSGKNCRNNSTAPASERQEQHADEQQRRGVKRNGQPLLTFSLFTGIQPEVLSKRYELSAQGDLVLVDGGGMMVSARIDRKEATLSKFVEILEGLKPSNALAYGVNGHKTALIVPARSVGEESVRFTKAPVIARDRHHFTWPDGPGLLMVDYDPPNANQTLTSDELHRKVYEIWPALRNHQHVWRPSASSCIVRTSDGKMLKGVSGQRLYVPLQDARDIPRAGKALFERSWLAGDGWYKVSSSGALLERGLVDSSVFQPERLDFAGGAKCGDGLEQRRPPAIVTNQDKNFIDSALTLPSLSLREREKLQHLKDAARHILKPEVRKKKTEWVERRIEEVIAALPPEVEPREREELVEKKRDVFLRAVEDQRLLSDFELISEHHGVVTVGEVLDNPRKFHASRFADPLEPEYRNDRRVAWANLQNAGRPYIFSHAHGGRRYHLHRAVESVHLVPGGLADISMQCLGIMERDGAVFDRGKHLARIAGTSILRVDESWLSFYLTRLCRFEKHDKRSDSFKAADCPPRLAKTIPSLRGEWSFPELRGVITAPTLSPDGRVIESDGFDSKSGLYLDFPGCHFWETVPEQVSDEEARRALEYLWGPFSQFPFKSDVDRGVLLAAVLTACVRQTLPTAPAFLITAPTAGSGKTLLTKTIAQLMGIESPEILPSVAEGEELRKRLFAMALSGASLMILDNLTGAVHSDALAAYLTSSTFADRILGVSEMGSAPSSALVLASGNNVSLVGDLNRRFLVCQIDPEMERPWSRKFDFDPETYAKDNRFDLVRACLMLMRWSLQRPALDDSMASFEAWSGLVRRCVVHVGRMGWLPVDDPLASVVDSYALDPETDELLGVLRAWREVYGDRFATISNALDASFEVGYEKHAPHERLREALIEIGGDSANTNRRKIGRWVERHAGRIVDGLRFIRGDKRDNKTTWAVGVVK